MRFCLSGLREISAPLIFAFDSEPKERGPTSLAKNRRKFFSRSHHAVIRVYDAAGNVISPTEVGSLIDAGFPRLLWQP